MSNSTCSNSNRSRKVSEKNINKQLQKSKSVNQNSHEGLYEFKLPSCVRVNNLNSLISSFSPFVALNFTTEPKTERSNTSKSLKKPCFVLENLWDSFKEWSAYGLGVPLTLNNEDEPVSQYFVPYLSALQLYVKDEGFEKSNAKETGTLPSKETTKSKVVYQYFEFDKPHERISLYNKVSTLAVENPCLKNYRSSDILPCSWFSVAWYPLYRIRNGPELKNIETSFLTFYKLSTHFIGKNLPESHDGPLKMSLPIFGLTTYKLKGSILTLPEASESQQMNSLLKAADVWLENLKVYHHDHSFFVMEGKQWIDE